MLINSFYSITYKAKLYILGFGYTTQVSGGGGGGQVRSLHAPVRSTQGNLKFELPSSDYRTTSGYMT